MGFWYIIQYIKFDPYLLTILVVQTRFPSTLFEQ